MQRLLFFFPPLTPRNMRQAPQNMAARKMIVRRALCVGICVVVSCVFFASHLNVDAPEMDPDQPFALRLFEMVTRRPPTWLTLLTGSQHALEVGGPSQILDDLGVYERLATSDNVRFARKTLWEHADHDFSYRWKLGKPTGKMFIVDAANLSVVASAAYDVVMSAHNLEHLANPLKAFREQVRVLKPGGVLINIVPNREKTFDHRRPVVGMNHLLRDLEQDTPETDLTHLDEILELHDLSRDLPAGNKSAFRRRSLNNAEHRGLHQHVFNADVMLQVFRHSGVDVVHSNTFGIHILTVGVKSGK